MTLPRLTFSELNEELAGLLRRKYERLGYLGEFYQVAASQPDALAGFIRFTESLKDDLADDLSEVVALTVAVETENDYERVQHERLALSRGFAAEWILDIERCQPDMPGSLDERQRAAQRVVLQMLRTAGRGAPRHVAAAEALLEPAELVAVLLTACRYIGHAAVANALQLVAPVSPPDLDRSTTAQPPSPPPGGTS